MLRVAQIIGAGKWAQAVADTITLDYDGRCRRRRVMTADGGTQFLIDLPRPVALADGDALLLDDGRLIRVRAAPESLTEIHGASPRELARYAWHVGNRHLPAQLLDGCLRLREDHVIVDMLRQLGAEVRPVKAPFEPEGGAYIRHDHTPHVHAHD